MAGYADDKTEPPTPRRRREARTKGQVARSQDLTAAVLILSGFLALSLVGPMIWHSLLAITRSALTAESVTRLDNVLPFAGAVAVETFKRLAPFLLILFFAMLVALLCQVGFLFTWQPLMPSLSKINPLSGIKRLFSIRSVMLAVVNFGKLLVVSLVAYLTLSGSAAAIVYAFTFGFQDVFRLGSSLMFRLGMRLSAALLILALLDLAWQRYRHERDLRMTKEEVKDELRSMEGSPEIKRRQRQVQLQMAMRRLRKDVPTADVVVTNPTHVAVAIRYDVETMIAPKVVAKGIDQIALRIRQIAAEFGIPIVERPPLARALHESVEVGEYVPERLYRAIAEILAYVYELTGRSPVIARSTL
ncbi:MAG: flagellar biosynthesis protein FlhB [Phycisphaerae bacterium]